MAKCEVCQFDFSETFPEVAPGICLGCNTDAWTKGFAFGWTQSLLVLHDADGQRHMHKVKTLTETALLLDGDVVVSQSDAKALLLGAPVNEIAAKYGLRVTRRQDGGLVLETVERKGT